MPLANAIRYHCFGKPEEVLRMEKVSCPEPVPEEVLIRLLAAPINPADFGGILGKYGRLKDLPAVAGGDGVGEIAEIGERVENLRPGQWVRFPERAGSWRELCVAEAASLRPLPDGLPLEMAAMAFVNPQTAIRLLEDFGQLQRGDWIIQNGANSNVGIAVIQYAALRGFKTINIVRRKALQKPLLDLGADVVFTEVEPFNREIRDLTGGRSIKLGLNSIGGKSALRILNALGEGGTHVTFGAMTFEAVRFPTRQLIFNDIRLCGFWLEKWKREHGPEAARALDDKVFSLIRNGTFRFPVEKIYPLSEFKAALEHHAKPRFGKVLLIPD